MKKIYLVGDIVSNKGPAIVNKSYIKYLKNYCVYCKSNNKIIRIMHFVFYMLFCKKIIVSGYSKLNYIFQVISSLLRKKNYYLVHGFVYKEVEYQMKTDSKSKVKLEYKMFKKANIIICVSEKSSEVLKLKYPEFKHKITFVNNGISSNIIKSNKKKVNDEYTILSVGGGSRIKNNLAICKAIKESGIKVKYIVIGPIAEDGDVIKNFDFVEYYEQLNHDQVLNIMKKIDLYIQNSYFETFCLSVIEAIIVGVPVLISNNIGAISIIKNLNKNNIIYDNEDINEIAEKLLKHYNSKVSNNVRVDIKNNSFQHSSNELLKILNKEIGG